MKKLLAVLVVTAVCVPVSFGQLSKVTPAAVKAKIEKARAKAENSVLSVRSADAHNKTVFDMELTVKSTWANPLNESSETHTYTKPCSAVRIDDNWLMASLTCRGMGEMATAYDHNGDAYEKEVKSRQIVKAAIRKNYMNSRDTIWARDIKVDEAAQIILIHLDSTNKDLQDELADGDGKMANLFIAKDPYKLNKVAKEAFINRERLCQPGRCSSSTSVLAFCAKDKCYQVDGSFSISGDAGDPLFFISKENKAKGISSAEFLVGFNNATIDGEDAQSGDYYRVFDSTTLNALAKHIKPVDPKGYQRIMHFVRSEQQL